MNPFFSVCSSTFVSFSFGSVSSEIEIISGLVSCRSFICFCCFVHVGHQTAKLSISTELPLKSLILKVS